MGSFLQTDEWGIFKAKYGWQPQRVDGTLILTRKILLGRDFLYAPETELVEKDKIDHLLTSLKGSARPNDAFAFRLELAVPYTDDLVVVLRELGFRKSFESVQPEWRAILDIRPDEEQILATMHQKARYNIRLAQRHNVHIAESKNLDLFHQLYLATAKRDGFSARGKDYFADFLAMVPGASLFIASLERRPLAAAVVVFFHERASYLYGASSSEDRQVMAPQLLHWEMIKEARRRGCTEYDLGEIPPADTANHPLKGLGDFKMKFGAKHVHLMGSWDYVYEPMWYTVFRIGEKLRRGFRA